MSLEAAIQENTVALKQLLAALQAGAAISTASNTAASTVSQVVADTGKVKEADAKKSATKISGDAPTASSQPGAKQESAAPKADAPAAKGPAIVINGEAVAITAAQLAGIDDETKVKPDNAYNYVKFAILALSKEKGREPTVALLARHGVTQGPQLKPEQYAQVLKDIDATLAGTYNPEAAEIV